MLDLAPRDLEVVRRILGRRLSGAEIRVFGSRTTTRAKRYSDLDLVIMGSHGLSDQTLAELTLDFEDSDLPFRVDILQWKDAPANLRRSIRESAVPIFNPGAPCPPASSSMNNTP